MNSRFNMMSINEISLSRPKVASDFFVIFGFFRFKLFPIASRFSAETVSLRSIPVSEWVLGIRSFFLIILLDHLLQETQILHLFGFSGLLVHSVFWDISLMRPTFSNSSISAIRMSPFQISPAIQAYPRKIPGKTFRIDEFSLCLSRRLGDIPTCGLRDLGHGNHAEFLPSAPRGDHLSIPRPGHWQMPLRRDPSASRRHLFGAHEHGQLRSDQVVWVGLTVH